MKVLITGATSMIGYAASERLLQDGHEVVAVVRRESEKLKALTGTGRVTVVICEMEDYGSVSEQVPFSVDAAFLTAWNGTRRPERDDPVLQETNYRCNMDLLPELIKMGCRKIVTAGSQAEYGPWTLDRKTTEEDIPHPNTEYGIYKLKFYLDAKKYLENTTVQLIEPRFFSIYGPEDYSGTMIISLLDKLLRNETCEMTKGIQTWDYLFIDDAIAGVEKLVIEDVAPGVYHFGSGDSFQLRHYVEEMYRITGSKSELLFGAIPYPPTGMVNVNPDVSKLMALGWTPKTSFEQGIRQILNHRFHC